VGRCRQKTEEIRGGDRRERERDDWGARSEEIEERGA
jgi:hypothetical protein